MSEQEIIKRVRVTGASHHQKWYASRMGEVFAATWDENYKAWYVKNFDEYGWNGWINKSDCEIVEDGSEPK
jgi:hypothetical protein